jgi:integrase
MNTTDTAYIDAAISDWIAEKSTLSGSARTRKAYTQTLAHFRARLQAGGRDLDLDLWVDRQDRVAWRRAATLLASEIRDFSKYSYQDSTRIVADNTCNARLIAISSFYQFAIGSHFDEYRNPVENVKRPTSRVYERARSIPRAVIARAFQTMDRETKLDARNRAMLIVFLETACRANEILALRWGNVEILGGLENIATAADIRLVLKFEHCKGGKRAMHVLSSVASNAVLRCLWLCYEIKPIYLDAARPLWPNLSTSARGGVPKALTYSGAAAMCKRHLGTSKLHSLRHTAARMCEAEGMSLREIQALLGHSHPSTTTRYLDAVMMDGENRLATTLAAKFGYEEEARDSATMIQWLALPAPKEEGDV